MERKYEVKKPARAGSLESNDILIMISPSDDLQVEISSVVKQQYGDKIEKVIRDELKELGVEKINLKAEDKGALDFTIRARVRAAVQRGAVNDL